MRKLRHKQVMDLEITCIESDIAKNWKPGRPILIQSPFKVLPPGSGSMKL